MQQHVWNNCKISNSSLIFKSLTRALSLKSFSSLFLIRLAFQLTMSQGLDFFKSTNNWVIRLIQASEDSTTECWYCILTVSPVKENSVHFFRSSRVDWPTVRLQIGQVTYCHSWISRKLKSILLCHFVITLRVFTSSSNCSNSSTLWYFD